MRVAIPMTEASDDGIDAFDSSLFLNLKYAPFETQSLALFVLPLTLRPFSPLLSYVEKPFQFGDIKFNLKLLDSACSTCFEPLLEHTDR